VVYSSNWENEIRDDGLMESAVHVRAADAQMPGPEASMTEQSMVLVDAPSGFDSAWDRATEKKA
jgi:peroxin-3